ncbi:MAG: efflux RND transporter periplasmic adaptor subunit [Bdellovibrionota bacterium]
MIPFETSSPPHRSLIRARLGLVLSVLVGLIVGCKGQSAPQTPPPVAVTVSAPIQHEVTEWDEFPARLESPDTVSLVARVSGIVERAPFQEGAIVQKGDVLFVLDERPFRADFLSKQAEVARAESQVAQAEAHFKRYEKLQGTHAISAEDFDEAVAALRQAKANIAVAKAALEVSKLSLDWTQVTAPITGRISRKFITAGNMVTGGIGQGTPLTTLTSVDPMYVYASVPERTLLRYQALASAGTPGAGAVPCTIKLDNETAFGHQGTIDFVDIHVDPNTGTTQIRCVIPNPKGELLPGLFTRLRLPGSKPYTALLVPDAAVSTDQNSRYVTVVGAENTAEVRTVKLGPVFGKLRVISEGLKSDDRVIVSGIQQARPGSKLNPTEAPIPPDAIAALESLSSSSAQAQSRAQPATQSAAAPSPTPTATAPGATS